MSLSEKLSHYSTEQPWTEPVIIQSNDETRLEELLESGRVKYVHDSLQEIANDIEKNHLLGDGETVEDRTNWVFFPWNGKLVRYPDAEAHLRLRTSRNQPLIRKEEQDVLYGASIASFGLSVGSKILYQSVESGVGQTRIIGDPDTLEPTNLNRLSSDMSHVGEEKVSIVAKRLSEVDPYIKQIHLPQGYTATTGEFLDQHKLDLIIEEVDDIAVKAMIRLHAAKRRIPVIMVTDLGEKTIVDVERYDLDDKQKPFNGKLSQEFVDELASGLELSESEKMKALIKLSGGLHRIPPRVVESAHEMKHGHISGIPQLGATAANGAILADMIARDILLGRKVPSGSHYINPRKELGLGPADRLGAIVDIYRDFLADKKA